MEPTQTPTGGNSLERFSTRVSQWAGSTAAFGMAFGFVLAWALTGPMFHFSQGWQMIINTGTTIATFLMVFLIQRAQNKESRAIQLKLNEVVAALAGASNRLVGAEELSEEELRKLHERYLRLAERIKDPTGGPSLHDAVSVEHTTDTHAARDADAGKER
ncbi:MAG: low affinity iron permease family protein [Acidobacteriota bacterium]|nr:low affinity iron permease family protein [Acidobacteriota bacterium]MDQ5871209.1 low affinity iron permease family protein [Acidobacteriota bacterium]